MKFNHIIQQLFPAVWVVCLKRDYGPKLGLRRNGFHILAWKYWYWSAQSPDPNAFKMNSNHPTAVLDLTSTLVAQSQILAARLNIWLQAWSQRGGHHSQAVTVFALILNRKLAAKDSHFLFCQNETNVIYSKLKQLSSTSPSNCDRPTMC